GPGRVWQEEADNGYSRASFPFALAQKNANCTHNGTMSFLFNDAGDVSKVWYQITQETCLYFKGDFWGQTAAAYEAELLPDGDQIKADFAAELAARFPAQPIESLTDVYPDFNLAALTDGISPEAMTAYGLVVDGVNYVSGCQTRYGAYPYCEWLRLPSYSTAKSLFAGMALMRLAQKYGDDAPNLLIRDYLPETADSPGNWENVTFKNTLDLATGNYGSLLYMEDEDGPTMTKFLRAETYADKLDAALSWPNQAEPGEKWVYHTSDTFLVTQAMQNYLQTQEGEGADIFQMMVDEVYAPIGLGPGAFTTLRTAEDNWQGRPLGGLGLWLIPGDVAKIATLLQNGGAANGEQLLHPGLLAKAMQQDPDDPGLTTASQPFKYNMGFWAYKFGRRTGYPCEFSTPFMSGFGGITIVMMPNDVTFYYFSDNNEYDWFDVVKEAHKNIRPLCE
ncbi:MAG TPA: class C beta-lactamase-related serine hydrolase, partial [Anaerolineae bacterium]|nr:class C beta-lactamase-related serine hydrolase [Anaerolineae bacterium]